MVVVYKAKQVFGILVYELFPPLVWITSSLLAVQMKTDSLKLPSSVNLRLQSAVYVVMIIQKTSFVQYQKMNLKTEVQNIIQYVRGAAVRTSETIKYNSIN